MPNVYVDAEFSELSERLAKKKTSLAGKNIFPTYMHLVVFAALIGQGLEKDWKKSRVTNRGPEISDQIFSNHQLDGVAYLLALHATRDGEILREKSDDDVWNIIQGYAAIGYKEIEKWLLDAPSDTDGVDTILNRIKDKAYGIFGESALPDSTNITF